MCERAHPRMPGVCLSPDDVTSSLMFYPTLSIPNESGNPPQSACQNSHLHQSDTRVQNMFESGEVCFITENSNGHLDIEFLIPSAMSPESIPETSAQLYRAIDRAMATVRTDILLDLSRIDFVSSAALNLLLKLRQRCEQNGIRLGLKNLAPQVRNVFEVTQLDQLLVIEPECETCDA